MIREEVTEEGCDQTYRKGKEEMGDINHMKKVSTQSIFKKISAWALLIVSGIAGMIVFMITTIYLAGISGNRIIAFVAGLVILVIIAGGGGNFTGRMLKGKQTRSIRKYSVFSAGIALLLTTSIMLTFLYAPVDSNPMQPSDKVQYWDLSTGSQIAYTRISRNVNKPYPVLLVHGGAGAPSLEHDDFVYALAEEGYDVYNYHQVGAGLSSRLHPDEYTVDRHVEDLEAIRQHLNADKVILIGKSWGGTLGANYMKAYPNNVEKAIYLAPGSIWPSKNSDIGPILSEAGQKDQSEVVSKNLRFILAQIISQSGGTKGLYVLMPEKSLDGLYERFVDMLSMEPGNPNPDTNEVPPSEGFGFWVNVKMASDLQKVTDPRPALKKNKTPVLIIRGQYDYIAWEQTREYRDTFPNSILLPVKGLGHVITKPYQAIYTEAIVKFLKDGELPIEPYTRNEAPL